MEITRKKNIAYVTELRALACIAIVVLHTFYAASAFAADLAEKTIALTVRNLMMWAVPCFVMITGALLLDASRNVTYAKLFRRYIPRVLIALLLFSVVFALMDQLAGGEGFHLSFLKDGLSQALLGNGWRHMWYLYLILGLYLMMPIYRRISAGMTSQDTWYLMGLFLVFLSVLPMIETLTETKTAFYICVYSVYPLYLFFGYGTSQKLLSCPKWLWMVMAIGGTVLVGGLTVLSETKELEHLSSLLENYSFPLIAVQAMGIFGLFSGRTGTMPKWLHLMLQQIDKCSFGIYLLHMAVLKIVLVYLHWNPYEHGGTAMVALLTVAVLAVTFALVWLLKKIPGLRQLL